MRERVEEALVSEIRRIHADSGGVYGSPRVAAELRARGHHVNVKRVARLMRVHHIAGIAPRRAKRTTIQSTSRHELPDLVCRQFSVGAPDRVWCSDITYIHTAQGWLYLAVVLDLGSRRLLGYAMGDRINTGLVQDAVDMAANTRAGHTTGIVFHTDRGSQYLATKLQNTLTRWGLTPSVGRVGSSADNAVAEAFFSTLKREHVNRCHYPDRASARRSIFEWLISYNTRRLHTSLHNLTPNQYETRYRHNQPSTRPLTT